MYSVFAAMRDDVDYNGMIAYLDSFDFGLNQMHRYSSEEIDYYNQIQIGFEIVFIVEMALGFVTMYIDETTNKPVTDIRKITNRYLNQGFLYDLIPLIPWNWIVHFPGSKYLFLLKSIRLI